MAIGKVITEMVSYASFEGNYDMGKPVKEVVELTMDEIAKKFNISVESLKIKK